VSELQRSLAICDVEADCDSRGAPYGPLAYGWHRTPPPQRLDSGARRAWETLHDNGAISCEGD
jgi:hypothetical protein